LWWDCKNWSDITYNNNWWGVFPCVDIYDCVTIRNFHIAAGGDTETWKTNIEKQGNWIWEMAAKVMGPYAAKSHIENITADYPNS
jgi:hypothetical protein